MNHKFDTKMELTCACWQRDPQAHVDTQRSIAMDLSLVMMHELVTSGRIDGSCGISRAAVLARAIGILLGTMPDEKLYSGNKEVFQPTEKMWEELFEVIRSEFDRARSKQVKRGKL